MLDEQRLILIISMYVILVTKKLLSSAVMLIVVLLILWALAGWYFGATAEQSFKSYLQENTQIAGEKLLRAELLDYRKTLMGAKASLRVSSDMPFVSERMGEFNVNVKLLNGPLFISKSGFSIGSSRWVLQIDESSLTEEELENLKSFFPSSLPNATVKVDFEQQAHYSIKSKTSIADAVITGVFNLDTHNNRGAISLDNFQVEFSPNQFIEKISAKKVNISYQHQKAITAAYKPGTTSVQIPSLRLKFKRLNGAFDLKTNIKSNISSKDSYLNGFIKADIKQNKSNNFPVDSAKLSVLFKGISADGFVAFSETRADFDNLKEQAGWVLEENGEFPEGQDQIWTLYDRIETASKQLPKILLKKMLNDDSLLQFKAETQTQAGPSTLNGQLKIISQEQENQSQSDSTVTKMIKSGGGVFHSLLSLLDGEAKVELDDSLFAMISKNSAIKKQTFTLTFKDNKLLMKGSSVD